MSLESLPFELLGIILGEFNGLPAIVARETRLPSLDVPEASLVLKNISLVSRRLREVCLPTLFQWSRLQLKVEPSESKLIRVCGDLDDYLQFIWTHSLRSAVDGLVVSVDREFEFRQERCHCFSSEVPKDYLPGFSGKDVWTNLLQCIQPRQIMIIAPPLALCTLLDVDAKMDDAWAFEVPFQSVRLGLTEHYNLEEDLPKLLSRDGVLAIPWTRMSLNESSMLTGHHTYHYWHQITPTALPAMRDLRNKCTSNEGPLSMLQRFEYSAVQPYVSQIRPLRSLLAALPRLSQLRMRIGWGVGCEPLEHHLQTLSSRELESEVSDMYKYILWQRSIFETLNTFVHDDLQNERLPSILETEFRLMPVHWSEVEPGRWVRSIEGKKVPS